MAMRKYRRKLAQIEEQHAIERDRARIAKDIHDDVGAGLTQITLLTELARRNPDQTDANLERIVINDLKNHTFFAQLVIRHHGKTIEIDSRPSDAIALGVANDVLNGPAGDADWNFTSSLPRLSRCMISPSKR